MPSLLTETDQETQNLKASGANVIVGKLKIYLKICKTQFSKNTSEAALTEILYAYVKALETPYPPSLMKAGFWYATNPTKHIETSTKTMQSIKNQILPTAINVINASDLNEHGQTLLHSVYKHLLALKLAEATRQNAIETNQAGAVDKMAHDVLQRQNMDFCKVTEHAVTPLLDTCHKKLFSFQSALTESSSSIFQDDKNKVSESNNDKNNFSEFKRC